MEPLNNTVILYHGHCPDGFASAYVAWKKFGEQASYIPVHHDFPPPVGLAGKELYIIDFSYKKEVLLELEKNAKSLIILDHHKTAEEAVKAVREHRFAKDQSGCGLAWEHFFSGTPIPKLIAYIQEGDLNRANLPHTHEILKVIYATPFEFSAFGKLEKELEVESSFYSYFEAGKHYSWYFKRLAEILAEDAELVSFERYEVYAVNVPSIFKHEVAIHLWKKHGHPFAIAWRETTSGLKTVSMRGNGSVDVSELAKRYSGGGHQEAASFRVFPGNPLPFKPLK